MLRVLVTLFFGLSIAWPVSAEQPLREKVDGEVAAIWKEKKVQPVGTASEATFLRRVYLDLVGTVPTIEEATAYFDDTTRNKRDRLLERLLADPRFASQMADVWDLALFGRDAPEHVRKRDEFRTWLTGKFKRNEPYDKLVSQILLGQESGSEAFLAQYRFRVEDATEAVTRVFLGTQLQCARCHDHPYEEWKQRDFYGMAGFLVRIVVQESGNGNNRRFRIDEKASGEVLFSGSAKEQRPGKKGDPVKPKFLGGEELNEPTLPKGYKEPEYRTNKALPKPPFSRKEKLANWVVARDNPYFAKAAVNRVWSQLMGRGLVHPIDDLSSQNLPTLPELLTAMAEEFTKHNYDLKWLIRELVSSKTYQLANGGPLAEAFPRWYERARVRPLSAEELLAAMRTVTRFDEAGGKMNAGGTREYFLRYFGKPSNGQGEFQGGLQEHLFLNNSGNISEFIRRRKGNLADQLATSTESTSKRVEKLFLAILTRLPSERERERFVAQLQTEDKRKQDGLIEEAIWVLINTAEFRFNR